MSDIMNPTKENIELYDLEGHYGIWIPYPYKVGTVDAEARKSVFELKQKILFSLKLQELVNELLEYGLPISLEECGKCMAKIQSLVEELNHD